MLRKILFAALAIAYNSTYTCNYFNNNDIQNNKTLDNTPIFETLNKEKPGPIFTIEYKPSNKQYQSQLFNSANNKPHKKTSIFLIKKEQKPFLFDFDINIYKDKNELLNKKRKRANKIAKYKHKNDNKLHIEDVMDIDLNSNVMELDEEKENTKWEKLNKQTQNNCGNDMNNNTTNIFEGIFNTIDNQYNNTFVNLFESLSLNNK